MPDDLNREALAIEIDASLPSSRLFREFERLTADCGRPDELRTDNVPEFLGEPLVGWCEANGILIDSSSQASRPKTPLSKGSIDRSEVLNTWLFQNLDEGRELSWG